MLDARTFLEAERRRIVEVMALALCITALTVVVAAFLLFIWKANPGLGIAVCMAPLLVGIGSGVTWLLIKRAPLWLAVVPINVGFLLTALYMGLFMPALGLFPPALFLFVLSISSLSNSQRLLLVMALVSAVVGIIVIVIVLPAQWTIDMGALLPAVKILCMLPVVVGGAVLANRFIASQNAALALAEQRSAEAVAARTDATTIHTEIERLQVAEQQRLIALVETLELPIIAVGAGMLVVPLVGELDGRRIVSIQARLLDEVSRQRASTVVLDLTGVSLIDTHVAQQLVLMAQAVRLLGARILLSGIRPDVAHTMVALAIDLAGMQPVANLGAALQFNDRRPDVAHLTNGTGRQN